MWTQTRLLIGAVCSGFTLFASILNSSIMLGNYLQQTTSADDICSDAFFSWRLGLVFPLLVHLSGKLMEELLVYQ